MILANYAQQNRNCVRELGAAFTNPLARFKPQTFPSFYVPDTLLPGLDLSGFPHGYNTEASWCLPLKTGALGGTASVTGSGTLAALGQLVKLAVADLTGSGGISSADAVKLAALAASLTGSGGITAADLKAFLQAAANLTGSGGVSAAPLLGFGAMLAAIAGSGTANGSTATGIGELDADLTVTGTGLSTANVGQAVWAVLQSQINNPGTAGAALLAAGSAGDPWSTALPGSYTAGTAGALLTALYNGLTPAQQQQLLDVWQRLGLDPANPLTQTSTSIEAGGVSQTLDEAAGPTVTVTRNP